MPAVVLATINARYIHCSLGLRCLSASLGEVDHVMVEYTIKQSALAIATDLMARHPRIVGLGIYIWNVQLSREVVAILKAVAPEVVVVLGGPEVSHEPLDATQHQPIVKLADHTIRGEGEVAFASLCRALLEGQAAPPQWIDGGLPDLTQLPLPYDRYTDDDIAHRVLYVEASRGCPFRCEFCLSALDTGVRRFPLDTFLESLDRLMERGATQFKFVDRTFNLRIEVSARILEFFLDRLRPGLFLHFELVPDRMPERLRELLSRFPSGCVQLEVGLQTLDAGVGARISRRQDLGRARENLLWLRNHTEVHIHADLIAGLPGEDLATFAAGFDTLLSWRPHEIQLGILKRLHGAPIARHDAVMRYHDAPPFEVLRSDAMDFATLVQLRQVARVWDLVVNSGNFRESAPRIWEGEASPFAAFATFTRYVAAREGKTHGIALLRLLWRVFDYLVEERGLPEELVRAGLERDYTRSGRGRVPRRLRATSRGSGQQNSRQQRHLD